MGIYPTRRLRELSLFTGAGGGLLGSRLLGFRTVCYVEKEQYCIDVIRARIRDGHLDDAPIYDDIRTFDGTQWRGLIDVITGGFPCQPYSVAGKQRGADDDRNLWPDTIRVVREVRPRFLLMENVSNLLVHEYARTIFGDLAASGYDISWNCIRASDAGAPHRRDRLWIVADAGHWAGGCIGFDSEG